jgi:hypothetical protein
MNMTEAQRARANISDEDFKRMEAASDQEQKDLASLAGKTVHTATFTNPTGEGLYTLKFTDGTTVEFSASGDDATFVSMNVVE